MKETKLQSLYWKTVKINDGLFLLEKRIQRSIKKNDTYEQAILEFINLTNVLRSTKNEMKLIELGGI